MPDWRGVGEMGEKSRGIKEYTHIGSYRPVTGVKYSAGLTVGSALIALRGVRRVLVLPGRSPRELYKCPITG